MVIHTGTITTIITTITTTIITVMITNMTSADSLVSIHSGRRELGLGVVAAEEHEQSGRERQ